MTSDENESDLVPYIVGAMKDETTTLHILFKALYFHGPASARTLSLETQEDCSTIYKNLRIIRGYGLLIERKIRGVPGKIYGLNSKGKEIGELAFGK